MVFNLKLDIYDHPPPPSAPPSTHIKVVLFLSKTHKLFLKDLPLSVQL